MPLKDLPADALPREKLLARGAQTLSDAELLAILLRTGLAGCSVLQLAQSILDDFQGFAGLLRASATDLAHIKGLGPAKRAEILAVMELAQRATAQQLRQRTVLSDPEAVKRYLQLQLGHRPHEIFAVLFLDSQNRLIAMEEMFRGTLSQTSVYPREIALHALNHHAASVILSHNHPSGCVHPSAADKTLTATLQSALGLLDIRVLDHIIVSQGQCYSMAQEGLL